MSRCRPETRERLRKQILEKKKGIQALDVKIVDVINFEDKAELRQERDLLKQDLQSLESDYQRCLEKGC